MGGNGGIAEVYMEEKRKDECMRRPVGFPNGPDCDRSKAQKDLNGPVMSSGPSIKEKMLNVGNVVFCGWLNKGGDEIIFVVHCIFFFFLLFTNFCFSSKLLSNYDAFLRNIFISNHIAKVVKWRTLDIESEHFSQ